MPARLLVKEWSRIRRQTLKANGKIGFVQHILIELAFRRQDFTKVHTAVITGRQTVVMSIYIIRVEQLAVRLRSTV